MKQSLYYTKQNLSNETQRTQRDVNSSYKLFAECKKPKSYSVPEVAQRLNINYQQLQEWAKISKNTSMALEMCRTACFVNADKDGLKEKFHLSIF